MEVLSACCNLLPLKLHLINDRYPVAVNVTGLNTVAALLRLIKKYWISITLFVLTVITILSLYPLETLPPVPGSDKTHHLIAYALLMFPTALRKPNYFLAIALFFICWSGAIELIQPLVNRYGELKDLIANIIGLVCGFTIARVIAWTLQSNLD